MRQLNTFGEIKSVIFCLLKEETMWNTLNQVADIRTGYTFRGRIFEIPDGNVHILQIKDLRKQYSALNQTELNAKDLPKIYWQGSKTILLSRNSIILPSRGEHYNAVLFNEEAHVVPTSQTMVITTKSPAALPSYICWAINQKETQQYLRCESRGSNIPLLSKSSLELLPIKIPSLPIQNKILNLQKLWKNEERLHKQLLENRENQLRGICRTLLKTHEAESQTNEQ